MPTGICISGMWRELICRRIFSCVFLRLKKEDVIYVCGTDEHGAPISIKAENEGVSSREIVDRYHTRIKEAFDGVGLSLIIFQVQQDLNIIN